jgi:hypothetical protein
MKGDFSRETFDSVKHFSRVLQQQGRVQLDADWNEQAAILLHYLRTLAADVIGPFAGPKESDGFKIIEVNEGDFTIGKGRYYVDGILCENEKETVTYLKQENYPNPTALKQNTAYLVYLDVWERHITALEDDYIREKALGGPDTATRTKVVWQVKLDDGKREDSVPLELSAAKTVHNDWKAWIERWQPPHRGCLRARVNRPEDSKDPCLTAPEAKYRGQENQLYRVEIHTGGLANEASFKWSRDNGSVVSRATLSGTELVVEKPLGIAAGNWVELTNDGQELRGQPGRLVKLLKVESDRLILDSQVSRPGDVPGEEDWPTKVRRWDQSEKGGHQFKKGEVQVTENGWIELENGVQIQFQPTNGEKHRYRTGDYWLIPARVATGDIEWPVELDHEGKPMFDPQGKIKPISQPPHGIRHHYAPLAILKQNVMEPQDCRCEFPPLNNCNMPSSGIDGAGGPSTCNAPEEKLVVGEGKKSTKVAKAESPRRGKPK